MSFVCFLNQQSNYLVSTEKTIIQTQSCLDPCWVTSCLFKRQIFCFVMDKLHPSQVFPLSRVRLGSWQCPQRTQAAALQSASLVAQQDEAAVTENHIPDVCLKYVQQLGQQSDKVMWQDWFKESKYLLICVQQFMVTLQCFYFHKGSVYVCRWVSLSQMCSFNMRNHWGWIH